MYEPDLLLYQKNNSEYFVFEDFGIKYANLDGVGKSTIRVYREDLDIDVTIDIANENGIHVDSPYNGYQAVITLSDLGLSGYTEIPDGVFYIEYDYSYSISQMNTSDKITRRFALYAIKERKVYKLVQQMYKYYNCDKPYASEYIKNALTARAMLKALETSAFMGFDEDYETISDALDNILE